MTDLIVANELRNARQVMDAAKRRSDRDQLGGRPPDDEPGEVKDIGDDQPADDFLRPGALIRRNLLVETTALVDQRDANLARALPTPPTR